MGMLFVFHLHYYNVHLLHYHLVAYLSTLETLYMILFYHHCLAVLTMTINITAISPAVEMLRLEL